MENPAIDTDALLLRTRHLADLAYAEDMAERGDITSALMLPENGPAEDQLVARQPGILAGRLIAGQVLSAYGDEVQLDWIAGVDDGQSFTAGTVLAAVSGPVNSVLSVERVLLNFLQRLCGVATATHKYVEAVAGTCAKICDTRKTLPGWRLLDKYAVHCGGGCNHRMGLFDAILIKDNHLSGVPSQRLASAVFAMLNRAAALQPPPEFVEIEADTLEQAEQLFSVVGVDYVLLDNFSLEDLRRAVELRDSLGLKGKVALEASGGITLDTVRPVAETGVERISVGAITHSVPALDLSLDAK